MKLVLAGSEPIINIPKLKLPQNATTSANLIPIYVSGNIMRLYCAVVYNYIPTEKKRLIRIKVEQNILFCPEIVLLDTESFVTNEPNSNLFIGYHSIRSYRSEMQ